MKLPISAAFILAALPLATGHGSVLYPPTRNAIDSSISPWKGARATTTEQFPYTGHWKYLPPGPRDCIGIRPTSY
jgi:hypothetical protein